MKEWVSLETGSAQKSVGYLCQRKYILDLLEEIGMTNCKPLKLPTSQNIKRMVATGHQLQYPNQYRRLVGKLIYLTITRPDITYSVQLLSQFMSSPTKDHMKTTRHVLRYLKLAPGKGIMLVADSTAHLSAYIL